MSYTSNPLRHFLKCPVGASVPSSWFSRGSFMLTQVYASCGGGVSALPPP
jgi:hypothetical protein